MLDAADQSWRMICPYAAEARSIARRDPRRRSSTRAEARRIACGARLRLLAPTRCVTHLGIAQGNGRARSTEGLVLVERRASNGLRGAGAQANLSYFLRRRRHEVALRSRRRGPRPLELVGEAFRHGRADERAFLPLRCSIDTRGEIRLALSDARRGPARNRIFMRALDSREAPAREVRGAARSVEPASRLRLAQGAARRWRGTLDPPRTPTFGGRHSTTADLTRGRRQLLGTSGSQCHERALVLGGSGADRQRDRAQSRQPAAIEVTTVSRRADAARAI